MPHPVCWAISVINFPLDEPNSDDLVNRGARHHHGGEWVREPSGAGGPGGDAGHVRW